MSRVGEHWTIAAEQKCVCLKTRSWPAARNLIGQRSAIHAGGCEPRPTDWNIKVQRADSSRSMPMGAVVATARLIECMQVVGEPDHIGLVNCRGFGELGDAPEYEVIIKTGPTATFRWACGADLDKWPARRVDSACGARGGVGTRTGIGSH